MDEGDVVQVARSFVADVDTSNIQNDLAPYLRKGNAIVREEELGDGESGFTVTRPDGRHVITVNCVEPEERRRFTVCHELGHLVLNLPSSHGELPSWSYVKRDVNEIFCDIFAAELLMPYRMWLSKVPAAEPSLKVVEYMAEQFHTSYPAAASRYASLASIPCAYVTMERGVVRYAARSTILRKLGAWISPRSAVPVGSVAHRLRAAGITDSDTDEIAQDVWFENWDKGFALWEIARHYAKFDTTLSLLWFSEFDSLEGEKDRFGRNVIEEEDLDELTGELPWPGKRRRR